MEINLSNSSSSNSSFDLNFGMIPKTISTTSRMETLRSIFAAFVSHRAIFDSSSFHSIARGVTYTKQGTLLGCSQGASELPLPFLSKKAGKLTPFPVCAELGYLSASRGGAIRRVKRLPPLVASFQRLRRGPKSQSGLFSAIIAAFAVEKKAALRSVGDPCGTLTSEPSDP